MSSSNTGNNNDRNTTEITSSTGTELSPNAMDWKRLTVALVGCALIVIVGILLVGVG